MTMISHKNLPLILLFVIFSNTLFAQNYEALSEAVFQDKSSAHVNYLRKAFQDNNAEQLVIDFQNIQVKDKEDFENTERKLEALNNDFKTNYTDPNDEYACQKSKRLSIELNDWSKSIDKLQVAVKISKAAYELCISDCNDELNSYYREQEYLNNEIDEYNEQLEIYKEYQEECRELANDYESVIAYFQRKETEIIDARNIKIKEFERDREFYVRKMTEVIHETPIFETGYYDNGAKEYEGYWSFKIEDYVGEYKTFHPNGQLETTTTLKNGKNHGTFTYYYETGVKRAEAEFENGVQVSEWTEYDENGKSDYDRLIENTKAVAEAEKAAEQEFMESIDNSSVVESIKANPIQTVSDRTEGGSGVEMTIDFSQTPEDITYIFLVNFDGSESKERRTKFINDFFNHTYKKQLKYYDSEGKLTLQIDYNENGGTSTEYNNDKKTVGEFVDGKRVGIWKVYDSNGNVVRQIDMDEQNKQNAFEVFGSSSTNNYADEFDEYMKEKEAEGNKE